MHSNLMLWMVCDLMMCDSKQPELMSRWTKSDPKTADQVVVVDVDHEGSSDIASGHGCRQ